MVRAEEGRITESDIIEGDFKSILRGVVEKAFKEWDEVRSDFLVVRDDQDIELDPDNVSADEIEELSKITDVKRDSSGFMVKLPIYMISFDNRIEGDGYVDSRIYVVTPLVNDRLKEIIEADAAHYTVPDKTPPRGIRDLEA